MLRAHAEETWLRTQVLRAVVEIEEGELSEHDLAAALAYLEVLWIDALRRAAETDAAAAALAPLELVGRGDGLLGFEARRLHASVRMLRAAVRPRVLALTAPAHAAGGPALPGEPRERDAVG
jgi:hypothetical protein